MGVPDPFPLDGGRLGWGCPTLSSCAAYGTSVPGSADQTQ